MSTQIPRDKPADEIAVTPEMIAASAKELSLSINSDGVLDAPENVLPNVFRVMMRATDLQGRGVCS